MATSDHATAGVRVTTRAYRTRAVLCIFIGGCALTQPRDGVDWQHGATRAYFEKRYAASKEIDLDKYPCFATVTDEAFENGSVLQVYYWSGKIAFHEPALTQGVLDLRRGDHVELLLKPCSKGEYSRVTRKVNAK